MELVRDAFDFCFVLAQSDSNQCADYIVMSSFFNLKFSIVTRIANLNLQIGKPIDLDFVA